ncbi:coiled-coil domain-containing protein 167-like [Crassostrea angulata]|uniref:Coiled-coil domain-containing protein 167 n=1 Tax=Magallana gigas TaxID=29159 RepID=A0A8W8MUZ3_MAGGI|nr:coiled-coil domain-containing protein 167-like [Crassostrea gigas]XP_052701361.1 coiled-coil domain-containing protein 167-like [Crassostrea angulata]
MVQTIVTQIEDLETKIRDCDSRLQVIDDTLRLKELQEAERQSLHEEEKQIKKKLTAYESNLKELRKENRKTMLMSVCLVGMMYLLYSWLWGT